MLYLVNQGYLFALGIIHSLILGRGAARCQGWSVHGGLEPIIIESRALGTSDIHLGCLVLCLSITSKAACLMPVASKSFHGKLKSMLLRRWSWFGCLHDLVEILNNSIE
jgi:hypothetical protein